MDGSVTKSLSGPDAVMVSKQKYERKELDVPCRQIEDFRANAVAHRRSEWKGSGIDRLGIADTLIKEDTGS